MSRDLTPLFAEELVKTEQARDYHLITVELFNGTISGITDGTDKRLVTVTEAGDLSVGLQLTLHSDADGTFTRTVAAIDGAVVTLDTAAPSASATYSITYTATLNIVDSNYDVTFNGTVYMRFPVKFSEMTVSSDGSVDKASLAVANVSREITYYVERYSGLRNRKVTVKTVFEGFLDDTYILKSPKGAYSSQSYLVVGDTVSFDQDNNSYTCILEGINPLVVEGDAGVTGSFTRGNVALRNDGTQVSSGLPRYETVNLVSNCDFEAGLATGATSWVNSGNGTAARSSLKAQSGSWSYRAEMLADGNFGVVPALVSVAPLTKYTVWMDVYVASVGAGENGNLPYARICSSGTTATSSIQMRYTNGSIISSWSELAGKGWARLKITITTDATASKLGTCVYLNKAGTVVYFDNVVIVPGDTPYYNPTAKAVTIEEGTSNLVTNGCMATDLSGWVANNGTGGNGAISRITGDGVIGTTCLEYTVTNKVGWAIFTYSYTTGKTSPYFDTSKQYTISFWYKVTAGSYGYTVSVMDSNGLNPVCSPKTVPYAAGWTYFTYTFTPAISGVAPVLYFQTSCPAGTTLSTIRVSGVQIEQKPYATSYCNGTRNAESLTLPSSAFGKSQGTIELWFNHDRLLPVTRRLVLSQTTGSDQNYNHLGLNLVAGTGCLRGIASTGTGRIDVSTPQAVPLGWNHVAMSYGSFGVRLYINGVLSASAAGVPIVAFLGPVNVGCNDAAGLPEAVNSTLGELLVSDLVKSDAQIAADYAAGIPVHCDRLAVYRLPANGDLKLSRGVINTAAFVLATGDDTPVSWIPNPGKDATAAIEDTFVIDAYNYDENVCSFALDPAIDLSIKLPRRKYFGNTCPFKFKDPHTCKYTGSDQNCSKTLAECKQKGNQTRFGGFPGITGNRRVWF